jgi:hypothetical protein
MGDNQYWIWHFIGIKNNFNSRILIKHRPLNKKNWNNIENIEKKSAIAQLCCLFAIVWVLGSHSYGFSKRLLPQNHVSMWLKINQIEL